MPVGIRLFPIYFAGIYGEITFLGSQDIFGPLQILIVTTCSGAVTYEFIIVTNINLFISQGVP
jgi:hypothetical protein